MSDMPMLKCGHTAMATHENKHDGLPANHPSCLICMCCEVVDAPELEGRTAKCTYFGRDKPRANDECNYGCYGKATCECGSQASDMGLAFFEHLPEQEQDRFYCGGFGWE
jgi:hypothetical protein